jgi:hypothetical protein
VAVLGAIVVDPALPRRGPAPPVERMSNDELVALVESEHPYRGRALFELSDRVAGDGDAATRVGALSRLPSLRNTRLFDRVSLAWSAIIALLAGETDHCRTTGYAAFGALDAHEQRDMLDYLECERIEDAHPRID